MHYPTIEAEQDLKTETVDPYTAAGIAFGVGKLNTFEDQMRLAAFLGAFGSFEPDESPN